MRRTEFIEAIKSYAEEKYGEVRVSEIIKGNGSYTGLSVVSKPGVPAPVVNLDDLYARDLSIEKCYTVVDKVLNTALPDMDDYLDMVKDWNRAKDRLFLRTFGENFNRQSTYEQVEDLFLTPYVQLDDEGTMVVQVTDGLISLWSVDAETVFEKARENQTVINPFKIKTLLETIGLPAMPGLPDVLVISTQNGQFGATAVFYPEIMNEVRDRIGENFYLIPSSIHEFLAVPRTLSATPEDVAEMVANVNASDVAERDRLSNSVYTYNFNDSTIERVA